MNLNLQEKQTLAFTSKATEILYGGAAGGGKIVANEGVVLTPFGWKKGKDLNVGDLINNPDGSIQRIVQIKPEVHLDRWTVFFKDGTKTDVAADHLWKAWRAGKGRKIKNKRVFGEDSAEIVETRELKDWIDRGYTPQIPVCEPQPFNKTTKEVDSLDPYLLGVILGDGSITQNNICITCHENDKEFYRSVFGSIDINYKTYNTIRFKGDVNKHIKLKLNLYGLLGKKSKSKFIPDLYLYSSVETRLAVIQGLMDTDGWSAKDKNACYYDTISEDLANGAAFILRSLGAVVTITKGEGSYRDTNGDKVICNDVYHLYIKYKNPDDLFRMPRKQFGCFGKNLVSKAVDKIEVSGKIRGRCITVSNPNGLYITNDFIVTHNSYLMRVALIIWCSEIKNLNCFLFRRKFPDLWKNHMEGPHGFPTLLAEWIENKWVSINYSKNIIEFNLTGSKIFLSHCQHPKDVYNYQGAEIHVLAIDELTLFEEDMYRFLRGRVRMSGVDLPPQYKGTFPKILCGSNPGNIGHNWVKAAFVDFAPEYMYKRAPRSEGGLIRQYIPAKLDDNPALKNDDPDYLVRLEGLGHPELIKAMRDGSWDIVAGGMFDDLWSQDKDAHVIEPFDIPKSWYIDRSFDWGSSAPFSVGWWAESDGTEAIMKDGTKRVWPAGTLFRIGEWYGWNGKPNHGLNMIATEVARGIIEREQAMGIHHRVKPGPADSAIFNNVDGKSFSIGDEMRNVGVKWLKSDKSSGSRVIGWELMRMRLKANLSSPMEQPGLICFNTCIHGYIRTIPVAPRLERNPEDIDTSCEDHVYDEVRYKVLSKRPAVVKQQKIVGL